jgi:uncharacterized protein
MLKSLSLVTLLLVSTIAAAYNFPPLTGRVVDQADLLSATAEAELSAQLAAHEQKTTNQVVVVTLNSLEGDAIEEYGVALGRHWGIGQKERDNGVLLLVAPNERRMRIEVGYGLEGTLTDAISSVIIDRRLRPAFRAGDYEAGIRAGVDGILDVLENNTPEDLKAPLRQDAVPIDTIIPIMFFLFVIAQFFKRGGQRLLPSLAFGGIGGVITASLLHSLIAGGIAGVVLFILIYLLKGGSSGGGGGGSYGWTSGSGGWSSGGGGFSGGGGSFGGGGSSGGW